MKDKEIIKHGTILTIGDDIIEEIELAVEEGVISTREFEQWSYSIYEQAWLPRAIEFKEVRVNRKFIALGWCFVDEDLATQAKFDLVIFKKLGYEIIEPEQVELTLCSCPDEFLTSAEIVHKQLILLNPDKSSEWIDDVLERVGCAMGNRGIVFYRP